MENAQTIGVLSLYGKLEVHLSWCCRSNTDLGNFVLTHLMQSLGPRTRLANIFSARNLSLTPSSNLFDRENVSPSPIHVSSQIAHHGSRPELARKDSHTCNDSIRLDWLSIGGIAHSSNKPQGCHIGELEEPEGENSPPW